MIVCSCFNISEQDILEGRAGEAGTDCGSCKEMIVEICKMKRLLKKCYTYEETVDLVRDLDDLLDDLDEFDGQIIMTIEYKNNEEDKK